MTIPSLYFKLIDTFPMACFLINSELEVLHINPSGLDMFGMSFTEINTKLVSFYFPQVASCIQQEGVPVKSTFADGNGNEQDVKLQYSSIDGNIALGMLYVTEQSHSKQSIIEQQKFNEIILDNIPADIAVFDSNHNYLYINPNGVRDPDTRKWMIGKNDFDYCEYKKLDQSIAQNRRAIFNKVVQTREQVEWIDEYHKDGKDIYVMRRFYPVFLDNELYYVIGYGVDVSELKRIQNIVIYNEKINKLILESASDAIIKFDSESNITFWNPKAELFFGWNSEEVLGKKVFDVILTKETGNTYCKHIKDYIEGNQSFVLDEIVEISGIYKNKKEFPIEISILPLKEPNGKISFCTFIRDITSRKQKELQVTVQNKMLLNKNIELEQFTYITSHDLQEPLLTLMSFSDLLLEDYSDGLDDEAKLYIEFINKSAIRMRALVTGLMEYARIGKRDGIRSIDCNKMIEDVSNDLSVIIRDTGTEIAVDNLPHIRGYETYIRLLFQNLISNAIKFKKKEINCKIKISCKENANEWKFSIEDNGIGIADKYVNQVFIIFKRLHNESLYKGHGIGLAHCKKIVDIHNGEISVKSTLGVGSTFTFTISKNIQ